MLQRLARAAAVTIGGALLAALAACGGGQPVYADETPTYFGADGHCYYLTDPSETYYLQQHGMCPVGWTPMLVPAWYETRYYGWVTHTYVGYLPPARQRTVVKVVNNYYGTHKTQIAQAESSYTARARNSQAQRQQSNRTYGSSGRAGADRAGGASKTTWGSPSRSTSRSSSTRSFGSGGRH